MNLIVYSSQQLPSSSDMKLCDYYNYFSLLQQSYNNFNIISISPIPQWLVLPNHWMKKQSKRHPGLGFESLDGNPIFINLN